MLRTLSVLSLSAALVPAQVSMTHLGTVDLSALTAIGTNPSAVAWNGTDLFVAGFNNQGVVGNVAIVRIANALTSPSAGAPFGVVAAPGSRGYSGLDVAGGQLLASYDNGAQAPEGITAWDLNGSPLWSKTGRGSSGVAFDPGFVGVDFGAAWATIGSGRRLLQDQSTGADVYTTVNGMIVNPSPSPGTTWRDIGFDDLTGDVWLRMGNKVIAGTRIGGNQLTNQRVVVDAPLATTLVVQNLAFVRQAVDSVVFWNDRSSNTTTQAFATAVRCNRTLDGLDLPITWGGFTAPNGIAAYDFSYDEPSRTLAICDFYNKAVYVFRVWVYLDYGGACAGQGGVSPVLELNGDGGPNTLATFTLRDTAPLSIGCFIIGDSQVFVPLPPYNCPLVVFPLLSIEGIFVTGPGLPGSGVGTLPIVVPPGVSGTVRTLQGVVFENGDLNQLVTSNGLAVIVP